MKGTKKLKNLIEYRDISRFTFGAVVVGIIILLLAIMLLLPFSVNPIGRRTATVRSNSMEPVFARGDVVFLQEADPQEIEEGDVIAFGVSERDQEQYNYPEIVIHRVIEVEDGHLFDIDYTLDELDVEDGDSVQNYENITTRFDEEGVSLDEEANVTLSNGEWWITVANQRQYRIEENGGRIEIHEAYPGPIRFETQGDAEPNPDPFMTREDNVIGQYTGSEIPMIGLVFLFANTMEGMFTLSLVFALIFVAVYYPWHIDKKEERYSAMNTLGSGVTSLHRRLTEIQEAMGETATAVGESVSGLMVSRTTEGKIADVQRKAQEETRPENIMMKRRGSEPEGEDIRDKLPTAQREREEEGKKEIDLRPLDELHKEFQKGELSVDEFIEMRKRSEQREEGKKEIDLRPLNELHKKFQRGEISVEEFIEMRKELKR